MVGRPASSACATPASMGAPESDRKRQSDDKFIGVGKSWASIVKQTSCASERCVSSQHPHDANTNASATLNASSVTDGSTPTSLITVLSSAHGRLRRRQRRIDKRDLQAAVKYGTRTTAAPNSKGEKMLKYTHADIVYITDSSSRQEVTSWVVPGLGIHIDKVDITEQMQADHDEACRQIRNKKKWTSHSVCLIDQSGSMRKDDVGDYCASRSDVVWSALAIEFVFKRINSGEATGTDVVTVLCMRQRCEVVIDTEPTDFILFNKIIDLLHSSEAHSAGNYIPALQAAEAKLSSNAYSGCALMFLFLSDGKPSDTYGPADRYKNLDDQPQSLSITDQHHFHVQRRISRLAAKYGRRLSMMTMGFGPEGEDFSVLKGMSSVAVGYGCEAEHINSALDVHALTSGLIRFSSTLTELKTECTDLDTGTAKTVRDVNRESPSDRIRNHRKIGIDKDDANSWTVFMDRDPTNISKYVSRIAGRFTWDLARNEFTQTTLKTDGSVGVAMCNAIFGEGAERMVHRFREMDVNCTFIGPRLVAKESRFVEGFSQGVDFHKLFCKTQATARQYAVAFNKKLDNLSFDHNNLALLPRIEFLDCSVFEIKTGLPSGGVETRGILVEEMLDDAHYKKWNGNNGYVDTLKIKNSQRRPIKGRGRFQPVLHPVYEFEESLVDDGAWGNKTGAVVPGDVPQAFSHFTYWKSDRKILVCDLQGVLEDTTQPPKFRLTDPVVHYKSASDRVCVYGRTDRGYKGQQEFFKTHVCSELCRLMRKTSHYLRRPRPRRCENATRPRPSESSAQTGSSR